MINKSFMEVLKIEELYILSLKKQLFLMKNRRNNKDAVNMCHLHLIIKVQELSYSMGKIIKIMGNCYEYSS